MLYNEVIKHYKNYYVQTYYLGGHALSVGPVISITSAMFESSPWNYMRIQEAAISHLKINFNLTSIVTELQYLNMALHMVKRYNRPYQDMIRVIKLILFLFFLRRNI